MHKTTSSTRIRASKTGHALDPTILNAGAAKTDLWLRLSGTNSAQFEFPLYQKLPNPSRNVIIDRKQAPKLSNGLGNATK